MRVSMEATTFWSHFLGTTNLLGERDASTPPSDVVCKIGVLPYYIQYLLNTRPTMYAAKRVPMRQMIRKSRTIQRTPRIRNRSEAVTFCVIGLGVSHLFA